MKHQGEWINAAYFGLVGFCIGFALACYLFGDGRLYIAFKIGTAIPVMP